MVPLPGQNCMGLSERDPWKNHAENESIEGNTHTMESNEGGDWKMVENKGTWVYAEG
jgi:hypothetical protein